MTDLSVHFSTGKDNWSTPDSVFDPLNAEFKFDLDAAADQGNAKTYYYLGPGGIAEDALAVSWADYAAVAWCNPPYSRGLQKRFVMKAAAERLAGVTSVLLAPARTDTKVFHDVLWDRSMGRSRAGVEVRFLKGRIKFVGAAAGAPFPSMVCIFRP